MIKHGKETSSQDYVLVDLDRNDHEVQLPLTPRSSISNVDS
jgi:hypothetical protein